MVRSIVRRWLPWLLKVLLTAAILVWLFRKIDLAQFVAAIAGANLWLLLVCVITFVPVQLFDTFRWAYVLRRLRIAVRLGSLWRHNISGQFFGSFLPSGVSSDVVRIFGAGKGHGGKTAVALSVAILKFSVLVVISGIALIAVTLSNPVLHIPVVAAILLSFLCVGACAFSVLCFYRGKRGLKWLHRMTWLPARVRRSLDTIAALPPLRISSCAGILALSALQHVIQGITGYAIVLALHVPIAFVDWLAVYSIVAIVRNVPVSISGLGVREGFYAFFLGFYGISVAQATASSLVGFFLSTLMVALVWLANESYCLLRGAGFKPLTIGGSKTSASKARE